MYIFKEILKQWIQMIKGFIISTEDCMMEWHNSVQHIFRKNRPTSIVSVSIRGKIKDLLSSILNVHHSSKQANINEDKVFS